MSESESHFAKKRRVASRKNPKKRSPKQRSPKQRSPKQRSPNRRSPSRRSPSRRSPIRYYPIRSKKVASRRRCRVGQFRSLKTGRCVSYVNNLNRLERSMRDYELRKRLSRGRTRVYPSPVYPPRYLPRYGRVVDTVVPTTPEKNNMMSELLSIVPKRLAFGKKNVKSCRCTKKCKCECRKCTKQH